MNIIKFAFMKIIIIKIIIIFVAAVVICMLYKKLIDYIFNLKALIEAKKDSNSPHRVKGGIVYNKKSQKLESAGTRIILPFD